VAGKHTERCSKKHDVRLDIWAPNTPKEKIINSWLDNPPASIARQKVLWAGGTYHDKVEFVLQSPGGGADAGTAVISRLLVRASGTEEINRICIECSDKTITDALRQASLDRLNDLIVEDVGSAASQFDLADRVCVHRHDIHDRTRQRTVL
jgi:phosphomannomutase